MFKTTTVIAFAAVMGLGACAGIDTDGERALIGAGAGCLAGEAINGDCTTGALAGGLTGALVDDL